MVTLPVSVLVPFSLGALQLLRDLPGDLPVDAQRANPVGWADA